MPVPASKGGFDMLSFSFGKIAPPTPPVAPADTAHRGIIIQWFDRIAEARMQRDVRAFLRAKPDAEGTGVAPERDDDH